MAGKEFVRELRTHRNTLKDKREGAGIRKGSTSGDGDSTDIEFSDSASFP